MGPVKILYTSPPYFYINEVPEYKRIVPYICFILEHFLFAGFRWSPICCFIYVSGFIDAYDISNNRKCLFSVDLTIEINPFTPPGRGWQHSVKHTHHSRRRDSLHRIRDVCWWSGVKTGKNIMYYLIYAFDTAF